MSYRVRFDISLGADHYGLTLKAQIWDGASPPVQVGSGYITTGFSEDGLGEYTWDYASFSDGFVGSARIYDASNVLRGKVSVSPADAIPVAPIARDSSGRVTLTPAEHDLMTEDMDRAIDEYNADGSTWFGAMYNNAADAKTAAESVDARFNDDRAAKISHLLDSTHQYPTLADIQAIPAAPSAASIATEVANGYPVNFGAMAINEDGEVATSSTGDVKADVQQAMTDQGYTTARAPRLDVLSGPVPSNVTQFGGVSLDDPLPNNAFPATFRNKLLWAFYRLFRTDIDHEAGTFKVLDNTGTVKSTQAITETETTETLGGIE